MNGTKEATESLVSFWESSSGGGGGSKVLAPTLGQEVDVTSDLSAFKVGGGNGDGGDVSGLRGG